MWCACLFSDQRAKEDYQGPGMSSAEHGLETGTAPHRCWPRAVEDGQGAREWELRSWEQQGRHTHHIDCFSVRDRDGILLDRMTLTERRKSSELTIIASINLCVSYG